MRVHPSVLEVPKGKGAQPRYVGILPDFKKPTRAAVRLLAPGSGKADPMVLPGAGWNFGLFGLKQDVALKAGATAALPLLLVAAEEPAEGKPVDLALALEALRDALLARLSLLAE
jgi:hypothetical protein